MPGTLDTGSTLSVSHSSYSSYGSDINRSVSLMIRLGSAAMTVVCRTVIDQAGIRIKCGLPRKHDGRISLEQADTRKRDRCVSEARLEYGWIPCLKQFKFSGNLRSLININC